MVIKVKNVDYEYLNELVNEHWEMPKLRRKYLNPCEKCKSFMLMDFEICPLCYHQQKVDE